MIILFEGGLGNQMFQYAYYLAQKERFPEAKVQADLRFFTYHQVHNGYELKRIFNIDVEECTKEISENHKESNSLVVRLLRKLGFYYAGFKFDYRDKACGFDEVFMKELPSDAYLYGFWQSEKYFENIKSLLHEKLVFPPITDENNLKYLNAIASTHSVGMHVRRGDYLNNKMFVNLSEVGYYRQTIEEIKKKSDEKLTWFIFSDDIGWCKENLNLSNEEVVYITGNTGKNSFRDMQLMTQCEYLILANSSFSWWGAYLNTRAKSIYAPKEYYVNNPGFNKDISPNSWIRI